MFLSRLLGAVAILTISCPAIAQERTLVGFPNKSVVVVFKNYASFNEGDQLIRAGIAKQNPSIMTRLVSCIAPVGIRAIVTDSPSWGTHNILITSGEQAGCRGVVEIEVLGKELLLPRTDEISRDPPAPTPPTPSAYTRGLAALNEGNFDAAIAEFTAAIADDPKDTFSYIRRGTAYEKKGDAASAIGDYRKVLKLVDADTGAEYAAKIRKLEKTKK